MTSPFADHDTDEACVRVERGGRVFLVRYAGPAATSIAQESPFGGDMWRLPVAAVPPAGEVREALRTAEAFVAGLRLPAVAS